MRISVIAHQYPVLSQTFISDPVEWLRQAGCDVSIVAERAGVVSSIPRPETRTLDSWGARAQRWIGRRIAFAAQLPEVAEADVLLVHFGDVGMRWLPVAVRARRPFAVYFHGYDASLLLQRNPRRYRRLFDSGAALLTNSDFIRNRLMTFGAPSTVRVVPLAPSPRIAAAGETATHSSASILTIARLVEKKGVDDAIAAFGRAYRLASVPWRYHIVGEGPQARRLIDVAHRVSNQITFHGGLNHGATLDAIRDAGIFLLASRRAADGDCEGTPIAILEAASFGLPVVATDHAGIPELLPSSARARGFIVAERDVEGLARALSRLMMDESLRREWGAACRAHVAAHYTADRHVTSLLRALRELASVPRVIA